MFHIGWHFYRPVGIIVGVFNERHFAQLESSKFHHCARLPEPDDTAVVQWARTHGASEDGVPAFSLEFFPNCW